MAQQSATWVYDVCFEILEGILSLTEQWSMDEGSIKFICLDGCPENFAKSTKCSSLINRDVQENEC